MVDMLKAALWYCNHGYSIMPAKKNKHPMYAFEKFITEPASVDQVRNWWIKKPDANIAILAGKNSNITVVDVDSQEGKDVLEDYYLSENLTIPIVKTPRDGGGWHYYFRYVKGIRNSTSSEAEFIPGCDVKTQGGYVLAPPSENGNGNAYVWVDGLHISKTEIPLMPEELIAVIKQGQAGGRDFSNSSNKIDSLSSSIEPKRVQQRATESNICNIEGLQPHREIPDGGRDEQFFHLANHLVIGGMPVDNIRYFLRLFLLNCTEHPPGKPYTERDIERKIKSALDRKERREKITTHEVREWVSATSGNFSVTNLYFEQHLQHKKEKAKARSILSRMVADGEIEKDRKKNGIYRKIDNDAPKIDILNAKAEYLDIKYPLALHEYFKTMQKNVIIIAGTQDVGKTAFLLNIVKKNMNRGFDIRYCSSEMGPSELRSRLELFQPDVDIADWVNVDFRERSSNFQDMIIPDGINIIDYLEISDAFYKVGDLIKEMFDRLKKGIAIIALQKSFKSELGRGAEFSLEKPRLYLTLTADPPQGNVARIAKCKNWARPDVNPNNLQCLFNVIQGSEIRRSGGEWCYPVKESKGKVYGSN